MGQMTELMDNHIVEDRRRRQHKPPVEGEGALCTAAPPAGLLVADGNAAVASAREREEIGGAFWKVFFRGGDISLFKGCALRVRQVGNGAVFVALQGFQIVRDNPVLFVQQKTVYLRLGSAYRQPQGDFPVCGDADGAGFAAAVDHLVGKFIKFALVFDAVYVFHRFILIRD